MGNVSVDVVSKLNSLLRLKFPGQLFFFLEIVPFFLGLDVMDCLMLVRIARLCQSLKSVSIDGLIRIIAFGCCHLELLANAIVTADIMLLVGDLRIPPSFSFFGLECSFSLLASSSERRRLRRRLSILLAGSSLGLAPSLAASLSSSCLCQPVDTSSSTSSFSRTLRASHFHSSFVIRRCKAYLLFLCAQAWLTC